MNAPTDFLQSRDRRYRSLLFVPGHKADWIVKAAGYGADGLILDLEDSVPDDAKAAARRSVSTAMEGLAGYKGGVFIRLNGWRTGHLLHEVMELVPVRPTGFLLPKIESSKDVVALDAVLGELEVEHGLPVGALEIVPLPESAYAIMTIYDVCTASQRVRRCPGGPSYAPGGDGARATGVEASVEGLESAYVGSRAILAARAAGLAQVLGGVTTVIHDLDLIREVATQARRYGCRGAMAIHPSHIPVINQVFTPGSDAIQAAQTVLQAMKQAEELGDAAVSSGGMMLDIAMAKSAADVLSDARSFGVEPETSDDTRGAPGATNARPT